MRPMDARVTAPGYLPCHIRTPDETRDAIIRLYEAGAYLVTALPDKRPSVNLYSIGPNGERTIRPKLPLQSILSHVEAGQFVLLYGPGDLGVGVVDLDPAVPDSVDAIIEQIGWPIEWYRSSGLFKTESDGCAGRAGYGGHLLYRINETDNRTSVGDRQGTRLGDRRAGGITSESLGMPVVIYDPVAFVNVMDADPVEAVNLGLIAAPSQTRSTGNAIGVHDTALADIGALARSCCSDDEWESGLEEIKARFFEGIATKDEGRKRRAPQEWHRFEVDAERWRAAEISAQASSRDRVTAARSRGGALAGFNQQMTEDRHKAAKSAQWRAAHNFDNEADPNIKMNEAEFCNPEGIARLERYRFDYLKSAIRIDLLKGILTPARIEDYYKASIENGLVGGFGEGRVRFEIDETIARTKEWKAERDRKERADYQASKMMPGRRRPRRITFSR